MKTCGRCGEDKTFDQFAKRANAKDGHQAYCKPCVKSYDRERYIKTDRPADVRARLIALRDRNVEWVDAYLSDKACVDCGNADRRVFHFDHRDVTSKVGNVSAMVYSYGLDAIKLEVAKCDVRCANCHLIRTGEQFGWRHALV